MRWDGRPRVRRCALLVAGHSRRFDFTGTNVDDRRIARAVWRARRISALQLQSRIDLPRRFGIAVHRVSIGGFICPGNAKGYDSRSDRGADPRVRVPDGRYGDDDGAATAES